MNKLKAAADIVEKALGLAPFEGWNNSTLEQAAEQSGYNRTDVIRVFPHGAIEAADTCSHLGDAAMLEIAKHYSLETMKVRERIATLVRLRLSVYEKHREGLRKVMALHALPIYAGHGLRCLYDTVDAIWHAAGDTATDSNFYTKRLLLAGVYTSTLLYWLNDNSVGREATWAFLTRRIDNVMQIQKIKTQLKNSLG